MNIVVDLIFSLSYLIPEFAINIDFCLLLEENSYYIPILFTSKWNRNHFSFRSIIFICVYMCDYPLDLSNFCKCFPLSCCAFKD